MKSAQHEQYRSASYSPCFFATMAAGANNSGENLTLFTPTTCNTISPAHAEYGQIGKIR